MGLHLHPALLRAEQHLEQPDLLHVWLPLPRLHHPDHHLLRDHHPPLLLPPLCRGLPLVVAQFSHVRLHSLLPGCILHPLFHHKVGHSGERLNIPLLRLHLCHGLLLFPPHRHNRLPGLLLVCSEDLQCGPSGLEKTLHEKDFLCLTNIYLFPQPAISIFLNSQDFSWFPGSWYLVLILGPGSLILALLMSTGPLSLGLGILNLESGTQSSISSGTLFLLP